VEPEQSGFRGHMSIIEFLDTYNNVIQNIDGDVDEVASITTLENGVLVFHKFEDGVLIKSYSKEYKHN